MSSTSVNERERIVQIMDCTLRDGMKSLSGAVNLAAKVVGVGLIRASFSALSRLVQTLEEQGVGVLEAENGQTVSVVETPCREVCVTVSGMGESSENVYILRDLHREGVKFVAGYGMQQDGLRGSSMILSCDQNTLKRLKTKGLISQPGSHRRIATNGYRNLHRKNKRAWR